MKTLIKIGLAVVIMGMLANLLFGGGVDKEVDLTKLIEDGALLIDTRTPGEFSNGSIEGAVNIPYDIIARTIDQHETDKSKCIIVFCHSGARSGAARKTLEQIGYTNVINGGSFNRMQLLSGK